MLPLTGLPKGLRLLYAPKNSVAMKIKPRSDWMDFNGCALDVMFQNYCNPSKIWKNRKSLIWNRFSGWCGCLSNTKNLNWTGRVNFARSNHALPVRWPSFCPWQPWDDPTSFLESCHGRGWIWGEEVDLETRPNINVCTFVWFLYMRLYIYSTNSTCKEKEREQPTNYNKESTDHYNKGLTKQEWDAP